MKRMLAVLLALCMLLTVLPALGEDVTTPTDLEPVPTEAPVVTEVPAVPDEPVVTEVPDVTPVPEQPTPEATEFPEDTAEPIPEATPVPTVAPWDESVCDHANLRCEQAPECGITGCFHVEKNVHGLDTALCERGRWVLARQEAKGVTGHGRIDLNRGGAVIWRSGRYEVTGGRGRENTALVIEDGRQVELVMNAAETVLIELGSGVSATISLTGMNRASRLVLGADSLVTFAQGGGIRIGTVDLTETAPGRVIVNGGSVNAPVTEAEGRSRWVFDAGSTSRVCLGESVLVTDGVDEFGKVYVWLDAPDAKMTWTAEMNENDLALVQTVHVPVYNLAAGQTKIDAGDVERFEVVGIAGYAQSAITASGAKASAVFEQAMLRSDGPVLTLNDEQLTIVLNGDNGFVSNETAIRLDDASSLTLDVQSGRLLLRSQTELDGITLRGNIKVEPEPELPHLCMTVHDRYGNPVPNATLTVTIGSREYLYTTHFDGSLHVWGVTAADVSAITATDGRSMFVLREVTREQRAEIASVVCRDLPDGTMVVTVDAGGAKSCGVQYIAASQNRDVAEGLMDQAERVMCDENGRAVITGVESGQTVSLRAFAAMEAGLTLTAENEKRFTFGEVIHWDHRIPMISEEGELDAVYTGEAYRNPLKLPEGAKVTYTGPGLGAMSVPVAVGDYEMHVTVPDGDPIYLAGVYDMAFSIRPIQLVIVPAPNQEKYAGDPDPEFVWTAEGLLEGDEPEGMLLREPGEDVGNYAFVLDGISLPDYYALTLAKDAPAFTILPAEFVGGFMGMWEPLYPVKQEIRRNDGRSMFVILNTQDNLTIGNTVMGQMIRSTDDNQPRWFSPSLSWNPETDTVVLRLRMEPEINTDKGYATNPDGSLRWGGRYLRISWMALQSLYTRGIDAVSISNNDAALTVPLEGFLTDEMQALVKKNGGDLSSVRFKLQILPVADEPEEVLAQRPVTEGWMMSVTMVVGLKEYDVIPMLPGTAAAVDLEPVARLLERVQLYDAEAFPTQFSLSYDGVLTDAVCIEPFMPSEEEHTPWLRLLYTDRYLTAPLTGTTTLWCVRTAK